MTQPLTLYHTTVVDTQTDTSANLLSDTAGLPVSASRNKTVNNLTGWGILVPQSSSGMWEALGSEPSPNDQIWLYDVTYLENQNLLAGDYTPSMRLTLGSVNPGDNIVCDLHYVFLVRHSDGSKTILNEFVLTGQIVTSAHQTYTFATATLGQLPASGTFAKGDKLGVFCCVNITANNTTTGTTAFSYLMASQPNTGWNTFALVTPGYTYPSLPAKPLYRGTYQFTNNVSSPTPTWFDSSGRALYCPYINGGHSIHYWNEIETSEGVYNWSAIDADIAAWASVGKKTIIRLSPSDQAAWNNSVTAIGSNVNLGNGQTTGVNAHCGCPLYLFSTYNVQAVLQTNVNPQDTVIPLMWDTHLLTKYQALITAFGARYDNNPNILFIQMGIGNGGETLCDQLTNNAQRWAVWQPAGYNDPLWWWYILKAVSFYQAAFTHTPLAMLVDSTFLGNGQTVNATTYGPDDNGNYTPPASAVYPPPYTTAYNTTHRPNPLCKTLGIWIQNDGLTSSQTLSASWLTNGLGGSGGSGQPFISEQLNPAIGNGRTLRGDLGQAIDTLQARYALIYGSDLYDANLAIAGQPGGLTPSGTSAASLAALQYAAAQVKITGSGTSGNTTSGNTTSEPSGVVPANYSGLLAVEGSGI